MPVSRVVAVVVALWSWSSTTAAAPAISLQPAQIDFPPWEIGDSVQMELIIANTGDAPLAVTDMLISGEHADPFTFADSFELICGNGQECTTDFTVAPGATRRAAVVCGPTQIGDLTATLTVTSNAGNAAGNSTVPLSCSGVGHPMLAFSPSSLIMPGTLAERGRSTVRLTITNVAPPPSADLVVFIDGPPWQMPSEFSVAIECPLTGPCGSGAGEGTDLVITFHPLRSEVIDAPITIQQLGHAPLTIPFHAEGGFPLLTIDQPANGFWLALPSVPVGTASTGTIVAHSSGAVELTFFGPLISLDPQIVITGGPGAGDSVPPGGVITWQVSCTPTSFWGQQQFVNFNDNSDNEEQSIMIGCGGIAPALDARLAAGDFDVTALGTSTTRSVRVQNQGNLATEVAISASDPHFTIAAEQPIALGPGDETFVDVTFTPTVSGIVDAEIAFASSAGGDTTLSVRGTGALLAAGVTPPAHDFGAIDATSPPGETFSVHNDGEADLVVQSVTLDAPADFSVAGIAAGARIAPGDTLSFDIHPTPSALGNRHGALTLDLGLAAPVVIPLDVRATDPTMIVSTVDGSADDYELDAGAVDVDAGPRSRRVTIGNLRTTSIEVTGCAVSGDPAFTVAACPTAIAPGETAEVSIVFGPTAEGQDAGLLTLTGPELLTGSVRIALRGSGLDQHVSLSASSVAFPFTFRHPASPAVQTVSITNTAAVPLALTSITVDGDGFSLISPAGATIAPGAQQEIAIGFAPAMAGMFVGHLVVGNADDPRVARVDLSGIAIDRTVAVSPLAIDMGSVTVGHTVKLGELMPGAIAIRNTDAAATFTISRVTSDNPAFTLIGPDRTQLAPGELAHLDVAFAPTAAGDDTATIEIFLDGDPAPHARVMLSAFATDPPPPGHGGCSGTGASSAWIALALLGLVRGRRRR